VSDGAAVPPALPEVVVQPGNRARLSLTTRTGLLAAGVAVLTVLIAALVAYPIVRQAAQVQAQSLLAQQADVIAGLLARGPEKEPVGEGGLADELRALEVQGIRGYIVRRGDRGQPPITQADIQAVTTGKTVSQTVDGPAGSIFIEGRPIHRGEGVVLVQEAVVATASTSALLKRLLLALILGLLLSVLVGWLASRRVTKSLREAATAAEQLSAGQRSLRLQPQGPAEVADIAESLNRLAAALAVSENRQRSFLMSVSHELRTPLTAVKGYAEALADGVIEPEDVARTGAIVVAEADRLERLVTDLLDLSRAGQVDLRLNLTTVDLTEFAQAAGQVWADRCKREDVPFRLEQPDHPVVVVTDPLRLRQIVDNLAENALRVTPAGRPIVLAVREEGDRVAVEIRDGGPGLSDDDLAVAFVPEELHSRYRGVRKVGTGLGLALVGSLATRLGATAQAGHAPEGGAMFTVRLPRGVPFVEPARTLDS